MLPVRVIYSCLQNKQENKLGETALPLDLHLNKTLHHIQKVKQPELNFCTSIRFSESDQTSHFSADLWQSCDCPQRPPRPDNHAVHIQVVIMRAVVTASYN